MDLSVYVPRHKGDLEAARAAVDAGYARVKPVLPQILEWHQDYNWPVAHILNELYRDADEDIIPHLDRVLRSGDWTWKYWVISLVIPQISRMAAEHFIPELKRLSTSPSLLEHENELDEVAADALREISKKQG